MVFAARALPSIVLGERTFIGVGQLGENRRSLPASCTSKVCESTSVGQNLPSVARGKFCPSLESVVRRVCTRRGRGKSHRKVGTKRQPLNRFRFVSTSQP